MKLLKLLFSLIFCGILSSQSATYYLSNQTSNSVGIASFDIDPVQVVKNYVTNNINLTYTKYSTNIVNSTNTINQNIVVDVYVTNSLPTSFSLIIEAESGTITSPFIKSSTSISNSAELTFPNGGLAIYQFYIPNFGNYKIFTKVDAVSLANNSFYIGIDATPTISEVWDINPVTVGFEDRYISLRGNGTPENNSIDPRIFTLSPGFHNLYILGRESKVRLDKLTILSE